jgi:hypothetical protein
MIRNRIFHSPGNHRAAVFAICLLTVVTAAAPLRAQSSVWAWGYNRFGQLGNGLHDPTASSSVPVQVVGPDEVGFLTNIVDVAAGAGHTLALKSDGTVWVWGNGYSSTPQQMRNGDNVGFLSDVMAISTYAGTSHNMVLKADGTVWAWGYNVFGQLGDGSTTSRPRPVRVSDPEGIGYLGSVVAIRCGGSHSLALKSDGTVWAWGYNLYGQLGDSTIVDRYRPVQTSELTKIVSITAGAWHNLVLKLEGNIQGGVRFDSMIYMGIPIRFEFRPTGGGAPIITTVNTGPAGVFVLTNIPQGRYHVAVKGNKWLQKVVQNVDTTGGGNVLNLRVNLLGGDADDNNIVDVEDLSLLIASFDATPTSDNWLNGVADFNCDRVVDVNDLAILIQNFDRAGDEF